MKEHTTLRAWANFITFLLPFITEFISKPFLVRLLNYFILFQFPPSVGRQTLSENPFPSWEEKKKKEKTLLFRLNCFLHLGGGDR